jgi:hypothetical protein
VQILRRNHHDRGIQAIRMSASRLVDYSPTFIVNQSNDSYLPFFLEFWHRWGRSCGSPFSRLSTKGMCEVLEGLKPPGSWMPYQRVLVNKCFFENSVFGIPEAGNRRTVDLGDVELGGRTRGKPATGMPVIGIRVPLSSLMP